MTFTPRWIMMSTERNTNPLAKPEKKSAERLLTAIRSLPKRERETVLLGLVKDRSVRRDLIDLATIEEQRNEPSRPFREYLKKRNV
jgi:hypothetical protein